MWNSSERGERVTAGLSHVQVWLEPNTPAGIEAFARVLEELDQRG